MFYRIVDSKRKVQVRKAEKYESEEWLQKAAFKTVVKNLRVGKNGGGAFTPQARTKIAKTAASTGMSFRSVPKAMTSILSAALPLVNEAELKKKCVASSTSVARFVVQEAEYDQVALLADMGNNTLFWLMGDGSKRKKRDIFQVLTPSSPSKVGESCVRTKLNLLPTVIHKVDFDVYVHLYYNNNAGLRCG